MPENAEQKEVQEEGAIDQRNKIVRRLAVAGVLVAVLLGVLAFFDYLATPPVEEPEDGPSYSEPVPVAPKKEVSQPVTPAAESAPAAAAATPAEETSSPPPPQPQAQPAVPVSEPKVESVQSARPAAETVPVTIAKPPVVQPVPPAKPSKPASPSPVPEATAAPGQIIVVEQPVKPSAKPAETRPAEVAPAASTNAAARLISGFLLQAGVFTSQQRAEELHAKLILSGVPSTLETRVQVGPFKTRQEAEAARAKLRELGIETVLVPPRNHP